MTVAVGVDGGGTKTDVCVVTHEGHVLAFLSGPGANWETVGLDTMRSVVAGMVTESLGLAGARPAGVQALACCMAGVDWPSDVARVAGALDAILPVTPIVTNDAFAALRAGTPDGVGLVSVAGTGGVTAGKDHRGRTARTMGSSLGEGAGATGITRRALDALARFHHGQSDEGDALAGALCGSLGCADLPELFERMARERLSVGAAQAPVILDLADAGDPLARALVGDAARQHAADVIGIARQLGLDDEDVIVVSAGGVHTRAGPTFSRPFAEAVTGALPKATIHPLTAPPAAGAALLALDSVVSLDAHAPVSPQATARLLDGASAARQAAVSSAARDRVDGTG